MLPLKADYFDVFAAATFTRIILAQFTGTVRPEAAEKQLCFSRIKMHSAIHERFRFSADFSLKLITDIFPTCRS
jgi:hypothetical protein